MSDLVRIVEVGPRDGLQNEKNPAANFKQPDASILRNKSDLNVQLKDLLKLEFKLNAHECRPCELGNK